MNIEDRMKVEGSIEVQFLSQEVLDAYRKRQEWLQQLFASIPQQEKENT